MALAILPLSFIAGLVLGDRRRATVMSLALWSAGIVALLVAKLAGVAVSPWEALVLAVCLPPAILLARLAAGLRRR